LQFVVVSDRDKGLLEAVATHFPGAQHFYCTLHLYRNLYKYRCGKDMVLEHGRPVEATLRRIEMLMHKAAKATSAAQADCFLAEIAKVDAISGAWLSSIPGNCWQVVLPHPFCCNPLKLDL
jgi:hypothetical protein